MVFSDFLFKHVREKEKRKKKRKKEVFRLIYMGDFDLDELSGGAQVFVDTMAFYVHLWFFGAAVVGCVLLMNLLLGVLANGYERCEENSQVFFTQGRGRLVLNLADGLLRPVFRRKFDTWGRTRAWFVKMAQSRPEEEISLRKVMELKLQLLEKALGEQIERLEISQNKVFNKLGKDVSEQNQQIGRLENKLDRITDLLLKSHGAQASGIDAG